MIRKDPRFPNSAPEEFGTPDIVLDAGGHITAGVAAPFRHLYRRTASTGSYMVEDLHTAYRNEYGASLRREGNFIELCESLIDFLDADQARNQLAAAEFARTTLSMHLYDSVAVFERGAS